MVRIKIYIPWPEIVNGYLHYQNENNRNPLGDSDRQIAIGAGKADSVQEGEKRYLRWVSVTRIWNRTTSRSLLNQDIQMERKSNQQTQAEIRDVGISNETNRQSTEWFLPCRPCMCARSGFKSVSVGFRKWIRATISRFQIIIEFRSFGRIYNTYRSRKTRESFVRNERH